ncbi:hypothetical protein MSP8887_03334 [Marinomonas spartinae]|uniref:Uncharacterized protein n=1 Tax=Marinomonas spartinae TaxID=1792290 RepID=A0A1A8TVX3_9GAMM|nr:hypothetical protein [Marinomonas spartinae]SBS38000.1 hypothetical protein MSP8886_04353 [Marinomonas spartinae]SBS38493.1 hypothetical protein MSP8887_03334 [Marinomonas spartinae]
MDKKRNIVLKKKKLELDKVSDAKGIDKLERTIVAAIQEQKVKSSKPSIQEFTEWE